MIAFPVYFALPLDANLYCMLIRHCWFSRHSGNENYDFQTGKSISKDHENRTLAFQQMISNSTTHLGVGVASVTLANKTITCVLAKYYQQTTSSSDEDSNKIPLIKNTAVTGMGIEKLFILTIFLLLLQRFLSTK